MYQILDVSCEFDWKINLSQIIEKFVFLDRVSMSACATYV